MSETLDALLATARQDQLTRIEGKLAKCLTTKSTSEIFDTKDYPLVSKEDLTAFLGKNFRVEDVKGTDEEGMPFQRYRVHWGY